MERAAVTVVLELRCCKLEFAAWETLEASKNWLEAEADVAEAIDFCEKSRRGKSLQLACRVPVNPWPGEMKPVMAGALGRRGGHQPLEFPIGDPGGHDHGPGGRGQHRGAEALIHYPHDRRTFMVGGGRGRPSCRRHQFSAGRRRRHG